MKAWPIDPLAFRDLKLEVSEKLPQVTTADTAIMSQEAAEASWGDLSLTQEEVSQPDRANVRFDDVSELEHLEPVVEEFSEPELEPETDKEGRAAKRRKAGGLINAIPAYEIPVLIRYALTHTVKAQDTSRPYLQVTDTGYVCHKVGKYSQLNIPANAHWKPFVDRPGIKMKSAGGSYLMHQLVWRFENGLQPFPDGKAASHLMDPSTNPITGDPSPADATKTPCTHCSVYAESAAMNENRKLCHIEGWWKEVVFEQANSMFVRCPHIPRCFGYVEEGEMRVRLRRDVIGIGGHESPPPFIGAAIAELARSRIYAAVNNDPVRGPTWRSDEKIKWWSVPRWRRLYIPFKAEASALPFSEEQQPTAPPRPSGPHPTYEAVLKK